MSLPAVSLNLLLQSGKKAAGEVGRHLTSSNSPGKSHLLRWLMSLGGLGLFVVALIDSSVIPLPLPGSSDLLLLLLASHRGTTVSSTIWLAACTFVGSMIGGYLTWGAGRKGGEVALERYIPKRLLKPVTGWVEKHGAIAVGIAALLPPPVPLTPFVLVAGALKVPRGQFLLAYGIARGMRYSLLAWLSLTYGRHIVRVWEQSLGKWAPTLMWTYGGLVAAGIGYGVWKFKQVKRSEGSPGQAAEEMA